MADRFHAVIVTGSRHWTEQMPIWLAIEKHLLFHGTLIHGDCNGADRIAASYADANGRNVVPFPYPSHLGKSGGPFRNWMMLKRLLKLQLDKDLRIAVLAFHDDPNVETAKRGGTADMLRKARAKGVPVLLFRSTAFVAVPALSGMGVA